MPRTVNPLWPVNRTREKNARVGRHSADTLRGRLDIKSELAAGTWERSQFPSLYLSLSLSLPLSITLARPCEATASNAPLIHVRGRLPRSAYKKTKHLPPMPICEFGLKACTPRTWSRIFTWLPPYGTVDPTARWCSQWFAKNRDSSARKRSLIF